MINESLWVLLLLLNFTLIMLAFRLWGKLGLFIWIPVSVIVANIQVTKNISLFSLEATLGNIVYSTGFLATDFLSEFYGPKESRKAIGVGFFALISMTLMMQVALLFVPSSSDLVQEGMESIFSLMPRIAFGSLLAYLASNLFDVWAYEFIKQKKPGRSTLYLRNCLSTFTSQAVDSFIFTFIAFFNVYPLSVWFEILLTTYVLKWIVAVCDTPFMYLGRHWVEKKKIIL